MVSNFYLPYCGAHFNPEDPKRVMKIMPNYIFVEGVRSLVGRRLFCKDWSAHFARVDAPCCIEAQWGVVAFSSDAISDVSAFAKGNFVSNFWYVNNISQYRSFLIR